MVLFAALFRVFVFLYFASPHKLPVIVALAGMGFFGFSIVPGMQLYIVQLSEKHLPGTADVSSALNIAAFNIGIALGSYAGGLVVESSLGVRGVTLLGAAFIKLAFILSIVSWSKEKNIKLLEYGIQKIR